MYYMLSSLAFHKTLYDAKCIFLGEMVCECKSNGTNEERTSYCRKQIIEVDIEELADKYLPYIRERGIKIEKENLIKQMIFGFIKRKE